METKTSVNTEKYIAFNNHILPYSFSVAFGFLLVSFGLWIEETIFTIFGILIALVFVVLLFISPVYYAFSNDSLIICHPFKRREIIYWEDIRSINKYGSWSNPKFMGLPHYKVYYRHDKEALFLNGEICRSRKTKRLLQKYYKGNVE